MTAQNYNGSKQISAVFPDLMGKTAIVTGASRGIGRGIGEFLGRQKMKLVLTARSEDIGRALTQELNQNGVDAIWVTADLSNAEQAEHVLVQALERFGRVDVLVNNAANLKSRDFLNLDHDWYAASFENNVRIVYYLSFCAAQYMAKQGHGAIINISSVGGLRAHRGLAGYDASNGAIDTLTRSMAVDLAPHGVRVNAVAPGATVNAPAALDQDAVRKQKAKGIPLGRMGLPEDIGAAVAFLASDAASYVTGQILYVDGGLTTQLTPPGIFI